MKKGVFVLLVCLLVSFCAAAEDKQPLTIHFLDFESLSKEVKSGDCSLLILPDNTKILVDCGIPDGADDVWAWLVEHEATQLDYFIATHLHVDHVGSFPQLISYGLTVGEIFETGYGLNASDNYAPYLTTREALDVPVRYLRKGDSIAFGETNMDVLWPLEESVFNPAVSFNDMVTALNNNSLVFRLSHGDFSILYTGDIYGAAEAQLVRLYDEELKASVLKVPHHGHTSSSRRYFVKKVAPKAAVATGHGREISVASIYEKAGVDLYITYEKQDVTVTVDGKVMHIICADGTEAEYQLP